MSLYWEIFEFIFSFKEKQPVKTESLKNKEKGMNSAGEIGEKKQQILLT